jgi:transcriptional regulator with GAF, ATPase, and Fis domain
MKATAWVHTVGSIAGSLSEQLVDSLHRSGIATCERDSPSEADTGILIFDTVDPPLLEFVRESSQQGQQRVLSIATSAAALSAETTWSLLHAGAADAWVWCDSPELLTERLSARLDRWKVVDQLMESPLVRNNLIGQSSIWKSCLRQVVEVARFSDAAALLTGESGTGKELVARLIHTIDPRPNKRDLVILDCTTVVPELSGSEFFGHERGAFTGATGPRDGAFALADGGTLFLDEVGELPLPMQAQLLRVVQERKYKRVGGNEWHKTDFRLVCATNRDLVEEVAAGRFRNDLYFRIATCILGLPPLRDRPEDILPLARHFLAELARDGTPPEIEEPVKHLLLRRGYSGNVREMRQLISRIATRHVGGGPITVGDIPEAERPKPDEVLAAWTDQAFETAIRRALCLGVVLKDIGQNAAETAIRIAVSEENGNLQRAAKRLGVTDRALQIRRANRR